MRGIRATIFALAALLAAGQSVADQGDRRLEGLFAQLLSAPNPDSAQVVQNRIWQIWYEHDDNAIVELMRQGHAAMNRRNYTSALRSFDQVVKIAPDFAEGWNARATLYYFMDRYQDSLADIEATLALEPRHFGALSGRGLVYTALEQWERALESFEAALEVHPQMTGPRLNAAAIRKALEDSAI